MYSSFQGRDIYKKGADDEPFSGPWVREIGPEKGSITLHSRSTGQMGHGRIQRLRDGEQRNCVLDINIIDFELLLPLEKKK